MRHLFQEAKEFITASYAELGKGRAETEKRLKEIEAEIETLGTCQHTYDELSHGAQMAWRNSNRCIGRLFWKSLKVFDKRHLMTAEEIVSALYHHIDYATNSGKVQPTITVFHPQVRLWNHQLVSYAGYRKNGGVIGDPQSIAFTQVCESLGWKGRGTAFDVLPLVVQINGGSPKWFPIPEKIVLEVDIRHPSVRDFESLGLKWYAVPIISDMALEVGGVVYPAAPFNGWYMETEIGARDFADTSRYNMLPHVASLLGLDTSSDSTLWRDRALVELNAAVLYSFKQKGVTIVDHHTAAKQFQRFEQLEADAGRHLTADWTWLIPPVSPAATHVFHSQYDNTMVKPNYLYQDSPF